MKNTRMKVMSMSMILILIMKPIIMTTKITETHTSPIIIIQGITQTASGGFTGHLQAFPITTLSGAGAVFLSAFTMAHIMIRGITIHGTMTPGIMTVGTMTHGITVLLTIIGTMTHITAGDGHITGITAHITDIIRIGVGIQEVIIMAIIMGAGIIMTTTKRKSFMEGFLREKGILFQLLMQKIKTCQVIAVYGPVQTIQNPPHLIYQVIETVHNPSLTEDPRPPLKVKDKILKVLKLLQTEIQMQTGHNL